MKFYLGKMLELASLVIVGGALMAGTGVTPSGQPSMTLEFGLLGIGGIVGALGWYLERGGRAS